MLTHAAALCRIPGVRSRAACLVLIVLSCLASVSPARGEEEEFAIGPFDVLRIAVLGQPEFSGEFALEGDGTLTYPFVGKIKASGMTVKEFEKKITTLLADGYLKKPQVSVLVKEYRSQRVFVGGEVPRPGPYPLRADRTLLSLLADLGPLGPSAGRDLTVIRPPRSRPAPRLFDVKETVLSPGDDLPLPAAQPEVFKVNLRELNAGNLEMNLVLRPGDAVQVSRAAQVYVAGHVVKPGPYRHDEGMTVLQALNSAGGVTERGSEGRAKIVRLVDGKKVEIKARPTDALLPEDTLMVPEKVF
jgi:polysaccharide export outer membrane protein